MGIVILQGALVLLQVFLIAVTLQGGFHWGLTVFVGLCLGVNVWCFIQALEMYQEMRSWRGRGGGGIAPF